MKLVLIGGGDIGKKGSYETFEIDQEVVKMTQKENPVFLFIGLASSYADSYYDQIKKHYQDLGCKTVYLKKNNLIHNPDLVKQKFLEADILYIGGGDTIKLLEKVEEYHLKPLFDQALKDDKVLVGISAGAILLSKEGYSDSYILRGESERYQFISGLGFFDQSIVPHYHSDQNKIEQLKEDLKGTHKICYGLENGSAFIVNDKKKTIVSSLKDAAVYQVSYFKQFKEKKI